MYRRYDCSQIKHNYHHLKVLPNNQVDLRDVKFVLGQDIFHLLFAMDYTKGARNEPWAVKTKLVWTLSGTLPIFEIVQIATAFAASDNDELSKQVKSWWSMESYASNCNVSARPRDDKRLTEIPEKTKQLVGDSYEVGLLWAEKNFRTSKHSALPTGAEIREKFRSQETI